MKPEPKSSEFDQERTTGGDQFQRFDALVRKVFAVPHDAIVRREKEYQRKRQLAKKRAKLSRASRASSGKD